MKKLYAAVCFITITATSHAQAGYNMYYQYTYSPTPQLGSSHGFGLDVFAPVKKSNYNAGVSYSFGQYGYKETPLEFITADGGTLNTTVSVTNSFQQVSYYQRYNMGRFSKIFFPFVDTRAGWGFFKTRLYIADPEDTDDCKPLEQSVLQRDNNWAAYAGAGVDIKIGGFCSCNICSKRGPNTGIFLNFSIGYAFGGKVSYMNANADDISMTGPHSSTHQHDAEGNAIKDPNYMSFINTQTQVVHRHHVGTVYTSSVNMIQMKAGISFKF